VKERDTKCLTIPVWPDAGKKLGISKGAAYEAARRGEIPTIKIGKGILVPLAALERMLQGGA
jgi:excisionase family DNA binding protein